MTSISIQQIVKSVHAHTALAAFAERNSSDIPAVITSDRAEALRPLIIEAAGHIASTHGYIATVDDDIITVDTGDRVDALFEGSFAQGVRLNVLADIYATTNPKGSALLRKSAAKAEGSLEPQTATPSDSYAPVAAELPSGIRLRPNCY